MPSALMTLDTGRPTFSGRETTEQKVEALNNYVLMLLENLRYILRNLGPENLNEEEMIQWVKQYVPPSVVEADSAYFNELYADYGEIADLVVDRLRTDYKRARNYLAGDTSDINYIYIHDETIEYRTASCNGGVTQLSWEGKTFYWRDATKAKMTYLNVTDWPVMVYTYDELVKAKIEFQNVGGTWYPVFQFGAGDGNGRNIGKIVKDANGLRLLLTTTAGEEIGLKAYAAGGAEAPGVMWFGTQAQYDALTKNSYTTYFVEATGS